MDYYFASMILNSCSLRAMHQPSHVYEDPWFSVCLSRIVLYYHRLAFSSPGCMRIYTVRRSLFFCNKDAKNNNNVTTHCHPPSQKKIASVQNVKVLWYISHLGTDENSSLAVSHITADCRPRDFFLGRREAAELLTYTNHITIYSRSMTSLRSEGSALLQQYKLYV